MQRVNGIGGVFFKARDADRLRAWYRDHLGIPLEAWGFPFSWRREEAPDERGTTTFSIFAADSDYFEPTTAPFMLNFRVDDLDAMLAQLREAGVEVDERVEQSEYGRFGWARDCEGRRFELWQPPPGM